MLTADITWIGIQATADRPFQLGDIVECDHPVMRSASAGWTTEQQFIVAAITYRHDRNGATTKLRLTLPDAYEPQPPLEIVEATSR